MRGGTAEHVFSRYRVFSGANGDRDFSFFFSNQQPTSRIYLFIGIHIPVDPYSAESADHCIIHYYYLQYKAPIIMDENIRTLNIFIIVQATNNVTH